MRENTCLKELMGQTSREAGGTRQDEEQAKIDVWKYVFGFVEMAVVKCAIELGIADAIESHGSPMTLSELSSTLGCSQPLLHRIMRFLVHHGVFREDPTSQGATGYSQTPLSRLLMRHGDTSMAAFVLMESSPPMLAAWHSLSSRVLVNGTSPFEAAHGEDVWSYASANLDHGKLINEAMACDARVAVPAILDSCPELLSGVGTLVDVGGGDGTALSMLVEACPWIVRGINFDLPHVVAASPERHGVEHVGGDMFQCVPKADAAFLMWVLHDWGDEECIRILKNCKEAIPKDKGKVIIVEAVIGDGDKTELSGVRLMVDMVMMAHTNNGKERTQREWTQLLEEAGFGRFTITPTRAVQSVIQAFP